MQVAGSGSCVHPPVDIHMVSRDLLICSFIVPAQFAAQLVEITFKLNTLHHHPPPSISSSHNQEAVSGEEIVTSAADVHACLTAAVHAYSLSHAPLQTMLQQRCSNSSSSGDGGSSGGGKNKLLVASYNILAQCYATPKKFCPPQSSASQSSASQSSALSSASATQASTALAASSSPPSAAAASDAALPPSSPSPPPYPSFLQLPLLALHSPHITHPLLLSASFRNPRLHADVHDLLTVICCGGNCGVCGGGIDKLYASSPHLAFEFHHFFQLLDAAGCFSNASRSHIIIC
jgi:hypothetical protein